MSLRVNKLSMALLVSGAVVMGAGLSACSKKESSASLVAHAKAYQAKGETNAAMIELKNALIASPDDAEARFMLAGLYNETVDPVSAEKEIRRAISLGQKGDTSLVVLGKALLAQGQFQKVLDETAPPAGQDSAPLLAVRADATLALDKRDAAKALFEAALKADPASVAALVGLGRVAYLSHDADGATEYANKAVAADGKSVDALMFKADLLRANQQPEQALAAYDQVLLLNPAHRTAHIEKASILTATGKFDAAQAELTAAQKTTPGNLLVVYSQAVLDFSQGKNAAAQDGLLKILRAAPNHPPSLLLAGAVDLNLGSLEQAEQNLKKYLEINPDNVYARKLLASAMLRSNQAGDALTVLAPSLKAAAVDPQLLALAGQSYMQARNFSKAADYFQQASTLEPKAAGLRTQLGLSKLGQGDQVQGISNLEAATTLAPDSLQAGLSLIRAEIGLRHFDKALAAVATLQKSHADDAQLMHLQGVAYLGKGDKVAARTALEHALAKQPTYYPAVADLAQMDLADNNPAAAKQRLETFLTKDKNSVDALTALAQLAAAQNQPQQATTLLEQASSSHPDAVAPAMRLAVQYMRTGQAAKALTLARNFQVSQPSNFDVLDVLGQAQLANKDAAGALDTYSQAAALAPLSALAQLRIATVQAQMKNQAGAASALKRALELQPDYPQAQLAQVDLSMQAGKPEEALATARAMQKQHPEAPVAYVVEGDIQLNQGKPALALVAYDKAYALRPSAPLMFKGVDVLKRLGRDKDAEQRVATWRKDHPTEPLGAMYVAEAALNAKQYAAAASQFEAVLKLAPNNIVALNNLAQAYLGMKDARALPMAEKAYAGASGSPPVTDTLGWVLVQQGNVARGLPLLQKALAGAPANPDIRYHVAAALAQSGDKGAAKKLLEPLLAEGKPFDSADQARLLLKQL